LTVPAAGATGPTSALNITSAGQAGTFTFSGTTGQKLSFNVTSATIGASYGAAYCTVKNPDNTTLTGFYCGKGANPYVDTQTLGQTGTYTIALAPSGSATGSLTMSINNDADITGSITIDGATVAAAAAIPGQDVRLSFTATAGQRSVVYATNATNYATVNLVRPDGSTQTSLSLSNSTSTFFLGTQTLATAGTYQLWVQHSYNYVATETLQIASVPPDVSGTLTIGGAALSFTTVAGQSASLTFSNPQSQTVTLHWTSGTYSSCSLTVSGPSPSTTSVGSASCGSATGTLGLGTLSSGTYTIKVSPQGASTGGLSLSVTSP
jgi:hypothetical protein